MRKRCEVSASRSLVLCDRLPPKRRRAHQIARKRGPAVDGLTCQQPGTFGLYTESGNRDGLDHGPGSWLRRRRSRPPPSSVEPPPTRIGPSNCRQTKGLASPGAAANAETGHSGAKLRPSSARKRPRHQVGDRRSQDSAGHEHVGGSRARGVPSSPLASPSRRIASIFSRDPTTNQSRAPLSTIKCRTSIRSTTLSPCSSANRSAITWSGCGWHPAWTALRKKSSDQPVSNSPEENHKQSRPARQHQPHLQPPPGGALQKCSQPGLALLAQRRMGGPETSRHRTQETLPLPSEDPRRYRQAPGRI